MRSDTLRDYGEYVSDRIGTETLDTGNYVTTDSMLPDKGGISRAKTVPSGANAVSFQPGDILISNIRPYLKKIWYAQFEGGASTDVLVFRTRQKKDSTFIYACLSQDIFFKYTMAAPKGSKMPRGDKEHILAFSIPASSQKSRSRIGDFIQHIDAKMQNSNQANSMLESLAKTVYDYWFVQFDFPDKNGRPYKSSGGKLVWNERLNRGIPGRWKSGTLGDLAEVTMGSSPIGASINENGNGIEFYQGNSDFGFRYPQSRTYATAPIRFAVPGDSLLSVRAPVGAINMALNRCCVGRGVAAIHSKYQSFIYCLLLSIQPYFDTFNRNGTTFGDLKRDDLLGIDVVVPPLETIQLFEDTIEDTTRLIELNTRQSRSVASLRDYVLPMLINGQATIEDTTSDQ